MTSDNQNYTREISSIEIYKKRNKYHLRVTEQFVNKGKVEKRRCSKCELGDGFGELIYRLIHPDEMEETSLDEMEETSLDDDNDVPEAIYLKHPDSTLWQKQYPDEKKEDDSYPTY